MIEKTYQIKGMLRDITQHGWSLVDATNEKGRWSLVRNGEILHVQVNPYWLYFTLPLGEILQPVSPSLYSQLLRLCRRCFMCKYSIDSSGSLLLQLELPLRNLERRYCHKAIEALSVYADKYAVPQRDTHHLTEITPENERDAMIAENGATSDPIIEVVSPQDLHLYFRAIKHYGWKLGGRQGANRWYAIYESPDRSFETYINFGQSWAYFQIPILNERNNLQSRSESCKEIFYRYLLQLNEQIYWVKFGVDEEDQVLLMLDMPVDMFDWGRFQWATRALSRYARDFAYDIQIMAGLDRDKQLLSLLQESVLLKNKI